MSRRKPSNERNLGRKDAARILGLSPPRINQLADEGRIGKMVAGRYLFTEAELLAFQKLRRPRGRQSKQRG